jgi:small ligand-binding sensory domain FIST
MVVADRHGAGWAFSSDVDPRRAGLLAVAEAAAGAGRHGVRTAIVFAAGTHAARASQVAEGAAEHLPDATVVVLGGTGGITPDAEIDGSPTVTALALPFPVTVAVAGGLRSERGAILTGAALGDRLAHPARRPVLFFSRPVSLVESALAALDGALGGAPIVGGGLAADGTVAVVTPEEGLVQGATVALRIDGGLRMVCGTSPAVQLISPWSSVDRVDRGFVRSLAGTRPLEQLTEAVRTRTDRPLVLAAVRAREGRPDHFLVRGISGIDPPTGSIHVGDMVEPGDEMAFGVIDPLAARADFGAMLRHLERSLSGGVPVAGIYIDCAGRGAHLYGRGRVDARAIRQRFPELPFAGLRTSFEIAPFGGRPHIQTYTGVLALVFAPS